MKSGKIHPVRFYYGRTKYRRRRKFNKHAARWRKGMRSLKPGELLQIEHMTVATGLGKSIKHFEATCPITKITVTKAYRKALSKTAADFLEHVKRELPFKIKSIQVIRKTITKL